MATAITDLDRKRVLDNFSLFENALEDYDYRTVRRGPEDNLAMERRCLRFFMNICDSIDRASVSEEMANRLDSASFNALLAFAWLND